MQVKKQKLEPCMERQKEGREGFNRGRDGWLCIVNQAEVDVFLEFPRLFYDPMDVGNLISGSSAFSKSSLNIWNFMVHVLLKPGLENFEHYFASV